jgi:hypothetical protein
MPYLIMAKFQTEFDNNNCTINQLELKLVSLFEGKFFRFTGKPKVKRDKSGMLVLHAKVEETSKRGAKEKRVIKNLKVAATHNEIMDMDIVNSKKLQDYLNQYSDDDDIKILCCNGAICKVRFNTGG